MTYFSEHIIEQIRANIDIVDLISEYIPLKKTGANFKGLCPFHQEKTSSFVVSPAKQIFHCFGCGAGGDIFGFLIRYENISYPEAIRIAAKKANIILPEENKAISNEKDSTYDIYYKAQEIASKFFRKTLTKSNIAKEYLNARGISSDTIETFQLGFALERWDSLLTLAPKYKLTPDVLLKAGLLSYSKEKNRYYDRFRKRIMFPICNIRGRIIAFGGRIIDDSSSSPKYLNSPETPIYHKGNNLYALHLSKDHIRKTQSAIIVEGYLDAIALYQAGIKNVIASLGTALSKKQANLLKRYASKVYIAYDADTAGNKATLRGLDLLLAEDLEVFVIDLPKNQDPDTFIKNNGVEAFKKLIDEALDFFSYKYQCLKREYSNSPEGKTKLVEAMVDSLVHINKKVKQDFYLSKLSQLMKLEKEENLWHYLKKRIRKETKYSKKIKETTLKEECLESRLLKLILHFPHLMPPSIDTNQLEQALKHPILRDLILWLYPLTQETNTFNIGDLLQKVPSEEWNSWLSLSMLEEPQGDIPRLWEETRASIRERAIERELKELYEQIKEGNNDPSILERYYILRKLQADIKKSISQ